MPLKGVEEPAAKMLMDWLLAAGHHADWKPVESDPPDLDFEVKGLGRWAVEVTEMQQYYGQQTDQEVKAKEAKSAKISLENLAKKIKTLFVDTDLRFNYLLFLQGPLDKTEAKKVEQDAIAFIESGTEGEVRFGKGEFDKGESRLITLPLTVNHPGKIYDAIGLNPVTMGADGKSYLADIEANHKTAIQRILEAKLPKLEKLMGYDRRVLLIWNSYDFGDEQVVREILSKTTLSSAQVDYIFFVHKDNVHLVANPGLV